jgi:hypothetical protein
MIDHALTSVLKSVIFWGVGLLALWLALGIFQFSSIGTFPAVDNTKWQAVFLSNNQVYFGKLENDDSAYVTLSDVYYLRTASDLDQSGGSSLNLIKLGGELHGPEDVMYIPKSTVLFWENMKDTSQVVETIEHAQQ